MIVLARLGGVLTIAGVVAVALIGLRGILGLVGVVPIYSDPAVIGFASLVLLGSGAAAIALGGPGVLATTAPRVGLLLVAIGCCSISLVLVAAQDVVPGSLGVGSGTIVLAGVGLFAPIGLLVTGASLVRSGGVEMIAGLLICVGGGLAVLGLFSSSVLGSDMSRVILFFGASMVGVGLLCVGLLAAGVGWMPSRATRTGA